MNYREAASFLLDLRRFRMKRGTESTERLLSQRDDPHQGTTFVQVAGSNGKGSTARMTGSILREAGFDVGLYTSPHVDDIRERVQVNGHAIPESAVAEFITEISGHVTERAADGEAPTFFEVLTALALWHFDRENVDVAVLEVGIGGRYDATSVIDPTASAVTSVSLEHTDILGDSVEEIARETADVAPADTPLVTAADREALEAIRSVAGDVRRVGTEDTGETDVTVTYGGLTDRFEGEVLISGDGIDVETRLQLAGPHQATNAGIAAALARQVVEADGPTIESGLRRATWPARFEVIDRDPLVVLDGAHNPGACEALAKTVAEVEYDDLSLVVGAMHDKDHTGMAEAFPTPDRAYTCAPATNRAEDPDVLARVYERQGVPVESGGEVESVLEKAIADAGVDDCVLVSGSLYVAREARTRYTRLVVPRRHRNSASASRTLERAHVDPTTNGRVRDRSVHRTVTTRLRPDQAAVIRARLNELGGACAVSGIEDDEERVEVVLSGTLARFDRLIEALSDQEGLGTVAADLRDALDAGDSTSDGESTDLEYPWESGTAVMGILNVTPDSFHDGGEYNTTRDAISRAKQMLADGADIIDVGGESTRPGADPVGVSEEIDRVVPVIERLADIDALVSVDTRKAAVAKAALLAGADIVNDVSGLEDPEMRHVVAEHDAMVVAMHSLSAPVDPDREVDYDDVVTDVLREVRETVLRAETAGIARERIIIDPGFGFGKSAAESFELLGRIGEFNALGCPVLAGHSHKSMLGTIDETSGDRLEATIAATTVAAERGADIVRVHDVAENVPAVRAVEQADRR